MRDQREKILKFICLAFAAILVYELASLVVHGKPVRSLAIPALPSLPASAEAQLDAKATNSPSAKAAGTNATNSVSSQVTTNKGTNFVSAPASGKKDTNTTSAQASGKKNTNDVVATESKDTNVVALEDSGPAHTNQPSSATNQSGAASSTTNLQSSATNHGSATTNQQSVAGNRTNAPTNSVAGKGGTNSVTSKKGSPPGGRPDSPNKAPELPPVVKARIDRIYQSEILGQVMRPLPMALLGIAGQQIILRTPSGQTDFLKEGAELGGIKLLQIGTNRVLIEQDGQKKELTIFSGLGSETLLPKQKESTNETTKKSP